MPLTRIVTTPAVARPAALGAVTRALSAPHRVMARAGGPWMVPPLSPRLQTPTVVRTLVQALAGRLVVTSPCATAGLPPLVTSLARAVLRTALHPPVPDDTTTAPPSVVGASASGHRDARDATERRRVRALLAALPAEARESVTLGDASWVAAALYEPDTLDVRFDDGAPTPIAPEPFPLAATVPYRLALVVGRNESASWGEIDARAAEAPAALWPPGAAPQPWFVTQLLLPDAWATRAMDDLTLGRWAALTGRAGPTSRDTYWFAETWERFREPGRRAGHVTPADIARSRRAVAGHPAFSPQVERGVCVPPGYALVTCVGVLEVSVVVGSDRSP